MMYGNDNPSRDHRPTEFTRRNFIQVGAMASAALACPRDLGAALSNPRDTVAPDRRFPYFQSTPVPYFNVQFQDSFWAPRQRAVREVSISWASRHFDDAGGLDVFRQHPQEYKPGVKAGDLEAIKFIEAMAAVVGVQRDAAIETMTQLWGSEMIATQADDGYWPFGWPLGADTARRWQPVWWSHEDYALGHYLESAIAFRESTGDDAMYRSAVRAVDNMASVLLGSSRPYAPGHEEIEQALMRLYGMTGETRYLNLCGWLIGQRGYHEGRASFGKYSQDHLPVKDQRTIEGHAVRAAFLFNGVTEYVGATGDPRYREAVLAVWDDLVNHKMYLHGAGGVMSAKNEGYTAQPDFIPPNDAYGESCSVFGNFQWAHNLFRLTGDANYIHVAERMLYNAFYASLSLKGNRYFYHNVAQKEEPVERFEWHWVPCCPPNIIKLFSKLGEFFYSIDRDGIFIKHYGASVADIPFGEGITLNQHGNYPWDGNVSMQVEPKKASEFTLRLRIPDWARSHTLSVNGKAVPGDVEKGWRTIHRFWKNGDSVDLNLPMTVERVKMPGRFKEYENLVALQRGPIVYCIEQQDSPVPIPYLYLPEDSKFTSEYRPDFLGGVTVLNGNLPRSAVRMVNSSSQIDTEFVRVMFIPYGVWNNRRPDPMWIWLQSHGRSVKELDNLSAHPPG